MDLLIGFRKSTPPQNRQLNILVSHSHQEVDDFVGKLTSVLARVSIVDVHGDAVMDTFVASKEKVDLTQCTY